MSEYDGDTDEDIFDNSLGDILEDNDYIDQEIVEEDFLDDGQGNIEAQTESVRDQVRDLFGFCPKAKQIEAIRHLIFDEKDLILIAATGYGKSLIFQAAPLMKKAGSNQIQICLIIMPLNQLQEDQAEKVGINR